MIRQPPRSTRTAHSFPTRRSSDLVALQQPAAADRVAERAVEAARIFGRIGHDLDVDMAFTLQRVTDQADARSEEHTSELQSLMRISYAVFCLKQKNNIVIR